MACEKILEVSVMDKVNSDNNLSIAARPETVRQVSGSFKDRVISNGKNGDVGTIPNSHATVLGEVRKPPRRIGRFNFTRSASSPAMVVQNRRKDGVVSNNRIEDKQIKEERDETKSEWEIRHRHVSFDECVHVLTKCSVIKMPLKTSTRFASDAHVNGEDCCECARSCLKGHGKLTETKKVAFTREETLRTAVLEHDLSEVERLCQQHDGNFNKKLSNGLTLLHIASIEGCFRIVQHILKQGARVNETDEQGWTPLHYAALHGNVPCALALLRGGADINSRTQDYRTALELASEDEMILLLGRIMNGMLTKTNKNKETYV